MSYLRTRRTPLGRLLLPLATMILLLTVVVVPGCISVDISTGEVQDGNGTMAVHFIDVGQGAGTLVIGPDGKTLLFDGGTIHGDAGDTLVEYINQLGLSKIDVLIASHPHADHINGLDDVVSTFDIESVYMPKVSHTTKTYEKLLKAINQKGLKIKTGKAGMEIPFGDVYVQIVAPNGTDYGDNLNEWSIAIRLEFRETSFIFTGDAEEVSEREMVESGYTLHSDVYLVGHHGSRSSTTEIFLDAVDPDYAVIQTGENSYGHPDPRTLKKLNARNIQVYRTDEHGAVVIESDGNTIHVEVASNKSEENHG